MRGAGYMFVPARREPVAGIARHRRGAIRAVSGRIPTRMELIDRDRRIATSTAST